LKKWLKIEKCGGNNCSVTAKVVLCGGFSRKLAVKESRGSRESADITAKSVLCVFFSRNHAKKMTQNKA